jgi:hypothetical protein
MSDVQSDSARQRESMLKEGMRSMWTHALGRTVLDLIRVDKLDAKELLEELERRLSDARHEPAQSLRSEAFDEALLRLREALAEAA